MLRQLSAMLASLSATVAKYPGIMGFHMILVSSLHPLARGASLHPLARRNSIGGGGGGAAAVAEAEAVAGRRAAAEAESPRRRRGGTLGRRTWRWCLEGCDSEPDSEPALR